MNKDLQTAAWHISIILLVLEQNIQTQSIALISFEECSHYYSNTYWTTKLGSTNK